MVAKPLDGKPLDRAVPFETTLYVRDHCLCLHTQRAARILARRFDDALRPVGLTNQQFSLLMSLNRPVPPPMGSVAALMGMDRTTLTAALKPLERRGLATLAANERDRRQRLILLLPAGAALLRAAMPIWTDTHARIEGGMRGGASSADLLQRLEALGTSVVEGDQEAKTAGDGLRMF